MAAQLALVTGASSGIGLSLAKELATRGYDVAICSSGERLHDAAETLKTTGVKVYEIQVDLSTREGVEQLWTEVTALNRDLENAGIDVGGAFFGDRSG
jgi:short-subunit dehydrogenase